MVKHRNTIAILLTGLLGTLVPVLIKAVMKNYANWQAAQDTKNGPAANQLLPVCIGAVEGRIATVEEQITTAKGRITRVD